MINMNDVWSLQTPTISSARDEQLGGVFNILLLDIFMLICNFFIPVKLSAKQTYKTISRKNPINSSEVFILPNPKPYKSIFLFIYFC